MEQFILEIQNIAQLASDVLDSKESTLELLANGTGKCKLYYI